MPGMRDREEQRRLLESEIEKRLAEHFAARCRAVIRIPYDSHLEEGAELDLDRVSVPTRTALLELAAAVADVFPHTHG